MSDEILTEEARGVYESTIETGMMLSERGEEEGGWAEYFDGDLAIEDDVIRAQTAVMLENERRWLSSLDEATSAMMVGGWRDYLYPIIRSYFPNNPAHELVSVQPQTKKVGQIFWLNYIYGKSKGSQFKKGERLFDASTGWSGEIGYTDETVLGEQLDNSSAAATYTGQVQESPIVRGNVKVTFTNGGANVVIRDDGNGGLVLVTGGGGIASIVAGSVNYNTGEISVEFNAALSADTVTADYRFDGELNDSIAQLDVELAASSVTAIRRAISMKYSLEAMQDFKAEFGMNLDQVIVSGCAQALIADVGGEIVSDLWDMAGGAVSSFPASTFDPATSGYSRREHFGDITYPLNQASEAIYDSTQKGEATWMIVDSKAATVLNTIGRPMFEPVAEDVSKQQGLVKIGTFNGKWSVYRYLQMAQFAGASSHGNILMGYKGPDFWDAGYVYAPYQSLYMSAKDQRADMSTRQAFATRYGKKRVNPAMYKRVAIS